MATQNKQEVSVNRSFAYTDKDGNQHYFTRDNQHTMLDVMPADHLKAYQEGGLIQVSEVVLAPEITPTKIVAASPVAAVSSVPRAGKEN